MNEAFAMQAICLIKPRLERSGEYAALGDVKYVPHLPPLLELLRRGHLGLGPELNQPLFLDLLRRLRLDDVRVARAFGALRADGLARLGGQAVDLLWAQNAAFFQDFTLLGRQGFG